MLYAYAAFLSFGAFCAGMTILGAWAAHELRKRAAEYTL